jgi:hypothetical protein
MSEGTPLLFAAVTRFLMTQRLVTTMICRRSWRRLLQPLFWQGQHTQSRGVVLLSSSRVAQNRRPTVSKG